MDIKQNRNKEMDSSQSSKLVFSNIAPIFHILSNEQQVLQRTDQKAFTMLSILGVFMVFFIVHFLKIQLDWFKFIMVIIYFFSASLAIISLVLVIVPRMKKHEHNDLNPTYFGGISQFESQEEYSSYFQKVFINDETTFTMFSNQVFALARINSYKNHAIKRAILFFVIAIISELIIIMAMAWGRAGPYLFPGV